MRIYNGPERKNLAVAFSVRMLTVDPGSLEIVQRPARGGRAADIAAPGLALGGTVTGAFVSDACGSGLALPASGLALTVAGAVVWLTGLPRERRDRITIAIGVAIGLLSMAALQQLFVCMLGGAGMIAAELLQAGGLIVLFVALVLALRATRARPNRASGRRSSQRRHSAARPQRDPLGQAERRRHDEVDKDPGRDVRRREQQRQRRQQRDRHAPSPDPCGQTQRSDLNGKPTAEQHS